MKVMGANPEIRLRLLMQKCSSFYVHVSTLSYPNISARTHTARQTKGTIAQQEPTLDEMKVMEATLESDLDY